MEAHVHEARFRIAAVPSAGKGAGYTRLRFTYGLSAEMATISDDYFELESCIRLDTSCE